MNILFISSLYPVTPNNDSTLITRALHNLVKHWNQESRVIVVRPVYLYPSEILKKIITRKSSSSIPKNFRKKFFTLDDIPVIVYPIYKIPKITYFFKPLYSFLDRYFRKIDFTPDIIIAHYDKSLHIGYTYSQRHQIPLVSGIHITPDLMTKDPADFTKRCRHILEKSTAIACRSNYIYNTIIQWFPQYREKCFIAFSGVQEQFINNPTTSIQRINSWKTTNTLFLITVSSLIERKKLDTILIALSKIKDKLDKLQWNFTIIGEGEEKENLQTLAKNLNIHNQVIFKGNLPHNQVMEELKKSNIFILVSYLETFGLVYLEAMAAGNLVIGAENEGIDGIIKHGQNGFLSPAGDPQSLTRLLEEILFHQSPQQLEHILIQAHETILKYTDRNAAKNYLQHLPVPDSQKQ